MLLDRTRAKFWQRLVFGGLAAIFATSFVIGGVGSGTNFSISDIFNGGSSGSTPAQSSSVTKAEKAVRANPKNAALWAAYGQALQVDNKVDRSIAAYQKAVQ